MKQMYYLLLNNDTVLGTLVKCDRWVETYVRQLCNKHTHNDWVFGVSHIHSNTENCSLSATISIKWPIKYYYTYSYITTHISHQVL